MSYLKRADEVLARASKSAKGLPGADTAVCGKATKQDPWWHALAGIENLPDTPGKIRRIHGEIRVASAFLLGDILGLDEWGYIDVIRLGRVMRQSGWHGPGNLRIGKQARAYAKPIGPNDGSAPDTDNVSLKSE